MTTDLIGKWTRLIEKILRITGVLLILVGVGFASFGEVSRGLEDVAIGLFAWFVPKMRIWIDTK